MFTTQDDVSLPEMYFNIKKKANFKPLSAPFQFSQFVFEQQKTDRRSKATLLH